jgi:hypothetical protein
LVEVVHADISALIRCTVPIPNPRVPPSDASVHQPTRTITGLRGIACELDRVGRELANQRRNVVKKIWKLTSASIVLSLALATSSSPSFAVGEAEARAACTGDVFRYCVSALGSLDRIISCLKQQKPRISKPCQAVMAASGN